MCVLCSGFAYQRPSRDDPFEVLSNTDITSITVSPAFQQGGDPLQFEVDYDPIYGTIHTNFTVPEDATIQDYSV